MPSTSRTDVIVLAQDPDDRQLMINLIHDAGFRPEVPVEGERRAPPDRVHATVICHRATSGPLTTLPTNVLTERVVVFSDSSDERSVVSALDAGAHHIFSLNDSPALMKARLVAALRRHSIPGDRDLLVSPFRFDLQKRCVFRDGELIDLSPKEFEFAYYLFSNRPRMVTTSELMTTVWSLPAGMDTRRIDTAACRVRKKMPLSEDTGWFLRRLRRSGYELYFGDERRRAILVKSEPVTQGPMARAGDKPLLEPLGTPEQSNEFVLDENTLRFA